MKNFEFEVILRTWCTTNKESNEITDFDISDMIKDGDYELLGYELDEEAFEDDYEELIKETELDKKIQVQEHYYDLGKDN